jgi:DNA-binding response OmpR family regulator
MDIMMPNMDGFDATLKIREHKNIPIIMLSAKSEDSDKIAGLNMGADDYITKPFNPMELTARVKSQLRRYVDLGPYKSDDEINVRGLVLNKKTKQVTVEGTEVRLTSIEYKILELLMENSGTVFSAEEIFERVWKEKYFEANNTVMVHIWRLREKVEENPKEPKLIETVWGVGYKIES